MKTAIIVIGAVLLAVLLGLSPFIVQKVKAKLDYWAEDGRRAIRGEPPL